jgi:3-hydroxyisobutyrate dehydrogenase-like beta-hydroxyacid dehydrogenase
VCKGGGQAYSRYFEGRALRVIEGNYAPTFTVDLMHKDVTLAAQMAGASLDHMPILREALAAYTEARDSGWGGEDFSGVTHVVEGRFGGSISR